MKAEEIQHHCQVLRENASARWFIEKTLTEPMAECDVLLHDLTAKPEAREDALHKWTALNEVARFLAEQEAFANSKLNHP